MCRREMRRREGGRKKIWRPEDKEHLFCFLQGNFILIVIIKWKTSLM